MSLKASLHHLFISIFAALVLAVVFLVSNPLAAADLHGPRVILNAEGPAKSAAPIGETGIRLPEGVITPDAFPGLDGRVWDNRDTDGSNGYSNGTTSGLGTLFDDFVVPAGGMTIKRVDWLNLWLSGGSGLGTGVNLAIYNNNPDAGGVGIAGPGSLRATAVVTGYGEAVTGRSWFSLPEIWSWATMDAINLPPGRYWVEFDVIGPENNFILVKAAMRDNECWVNWPSLGGIQPCSDQFGGVMVDLTWTLSSHHQYSVAFASLGGSNAGADDPGAVFIIDANTGANRYVGTPMPGRGLPGLAVDSLNRLFAVTDNAGGVSTAKLLQLNPRDATMVREIGDLRMGATPEALSDLAIQPGTDVLFGVETFNCAVERNNLVTVNTGTAAVTSVGIDPAIAAVNAFIAIAFGPNGTLWAKSSNGPELFTLDPSTAAVLTTSSTTPAGVGSIGLGVRPMNGQLFMSECCIFTDGNDIYSLDTTTNDAAFLGSFGGDRRVHDFAFVFYIFVDPLESMDLSAWTLAVP